MTGSLLINCFPIRPTADSRTIYVSHAELDGWQPISKSFVTGVRGDQSDKLYWSFESAAEAAEHSVGIDDTHFFKRLLSQQLFEHFQGSQLPRCRSFLGGTEVWVRRERADPNYAASYDVFIVRVLDPTDQFATRGWTLLLTYDGVTNTCWRRTGSITIPDELTRRFVHNNQIVSMKHWTGAIPSDSEIVLNRDIFKLLGIQPQRRKTQNKYSTFHGMVAEFYNDHLRGREIGDMRVLESGMGEVLDSQVWKTSVESNVLEFGNGGTHFNAYMGLKEYGPLAGPTLEPYRFFFIFHESDRDRANKLYQFLNRGFKGYPGLKAFCSLDLNLDRDLTITFADRIRPSTDIVNALNTCQFDPDCRYLAIYISPIERDEQDDDKRQEYFRIKQALLAHNISSQVVFTDNIDNPNFNFFLPNISLAILAKLGGTPWRLSREVREELVLGIGAFRQSSEKFLGTTFAFRNDGSFVSFDAASCPKVADLCVFFEKAIHASVAEVKQVRRVVIHFYKKMNKDEERQLAIAMSRLSIQVPYIVLTIVDEGMHEYVVFDPNYDGKMPRSGTCVKLRRGEYLLCNNTRYSERTGARIDDFPFPLRISLSKTNAGPLDEQTTRELIDQVYQFSRMYWRSVKQRAMPATILYSESVAKMAAMFPDGVIPATYVGQHTLWFL